MKDREPESGLCHTWVDYIGGVIMGTVPIF